MTNLDSILKNRDITLPTKVRPVKAIVFLVVMYGCDSWTIKKAECQRIDAFELWCCRRLLRVPWTARRSNQSIIKVNAFEWWCWRRLLRVPWTARRFNQSILKEISPGCSLEGLMLKLKLQYFGYLMQRADSFEKTLITSLGWMHETSARAWYTGKTQRDRVERKVGGGIRVGNTCKSMADSCQCMTETTTVL